GVPGARSDDADQLSREGRAGRRSLPEWTLHGDRKAEAGGDGVSVPARAGDAHRLARRRLGPGATAQRRAGVPAAGAARRSVALPRRHDAHELARVLLADDRGAARFAGPPLVT